MKIRTNKINFSLNVENILSRYDVFYIKYKGQIFDKNILDMDFEPEHKAKAVVYMYGKNAFMLFDKNQITADELHEILNQEYNQPKVDVWHQKSFNEDYPNVYIDFKHWKISSAPYNDKDAIMTEIRRKMDKIGAQRVYVIGILKDSESIANASSDEQIITIPYLVDKNGEIARDMLKNIKEA